jgi:hypothetical protein
MRGSRWIPAALAALAVATSLDAMPRAQGQAPAIALRTNGSVMRPGDCLRIEAIALEYVPGPFAARVTYRFEEFLLVRDKEGAEAPASRSAQVQRPVGPSIDALTPFQPLLLDDTFCFGQGTAPGHYRVEVALLAGSSGPPFGTLTTCALFDDGGSRPAEAGPGCGFLVRGVRRVDSADIVVFDAELPASGLYRAAILRGGAVDAVLDAGVYQTGPRELTVMSPEFGRADGSTVDMVVFEQFRGASSTAVRLSLPRKN